MIDMKLRFAHNSEKHYKTEFNHKELKCSDLNNISCSLDVIYLGKIY